MAGQQSKQHEGLAQTTSYAEGSPEEWRRLACQAPVVEPAETVINYGEEVGDNEQIRAVQQRHQVQAGCCRTVVLAKAPAPPPPGPPPAAPPSTEEAARSEPLEEKRKRLSKPKGSDASDRAQVAGAALEERSSVTESGLPTSSQAPGLPAQTLEIVIFSRFRYVRFVIVSKSLDSLGSLSVRYLL